MTQEEKDLLIKDLSARLLYKVKFPFNLWDEEKQEEVNAVCTIYSVNTDGYCEALEESGHIPLDVVKPYLRPMSSMTEEEKKEYIEYAGYEIEESVNGRHYEYYLKDFCGTPNNPSVNADGFEWLNKNMFDFRGLIPKGLANVAPDGMYTAKTSKI